MADKNFWVDGGSLETTDEGRTLYMSVRKEFVMGDKSKNKVVAVYFKDYENTDPTHKILDQGEYYVIYNTPADEFDNLVEKIKKFDPANGRHPFLCLEFKRKELTKVFCYVKQN